MQEDFPESVEYGYCHCGCGSKTTIATRNHKRHGMIKGSPMRFLKGHQVRLRIGKDAPGWKGGKSIKKYKNTSYVRINIPGHSRGDNGRVLEHILIVEELLGWPLPKGAVVHHIDGNGLNNKPSNLMVFKNNTEHLKHHRSCGD